MVKSKKLPAFQFYTGDYMKDHALRACSLAARGLWMDMLCLMHDSSMRGHLVLAEGIAMDDQQIARICGATPDEVDALTAELERTGVVSRGAVGEYVSRRMVRDEATRQAMSEGGRKGGIQSSLKRKGGSSSSPSPSTSTSTKTERQDSSSAYWIVAGDPSVQKVMSAVPKQTALAINEALELVQTKMEDELSGKSDRNQAASFLCERVSSYYVSEEGQGRFYRSPARWFEEGGYDEHDEAWCSRTASTEF